MCEYFLVIWRTLLFYYAVTNQLFQKLHWGDEEALTPNHFRTRNSSSLQQWQPWEIRDGKFHRWWPFYEAMRLWHVLENKRQSSPKLTLCAFSPTLALRNSGTAGCTAVKLHMLTIRSNVLMEWTSMHSEFMTSSIPPKNVECGSKSKSEDLWVNMNSVNC